MSNNQVLITEPKIADLQGIVDAQRDAWRATYPSVEHGVSKEWVYDFSANLSADYIAERLDAYKADPNNLYIIAKTMNGEVCGFLHAEKQTDFNELSAIYVSPQYIGKRVGGVLMREFIDWLDPTKPSKLECVAYNERAIGFYEHYGFKKTDTALPKFGDVLPLIEMVRPANS